MVNSSKFHHFLFAKIKEALYPPKKATQCGLSVEKLNDVLITNIVYGIIRLI